MLEFFQFSKRLIFHTVHVVEAHFLLKNLYTGKNAQVVRLPHI